MTVEAFEEKRDIEDFDLAIESDLDDCEVEGLEKVGEEKVGEEMLGNCKVRSGRLNSENLISGNLISISERVACESCNADIEDLTSE